ncbi:MAG: TRAP transporter TatT component family protein [Thermodesulfobacteriota bacterium]
MKRLLVVFCLIPAFSGFFFGCNSTRFMVDRMVPVTEKMNAAVNQNTDIAMVKEAMPSAIIQLEGMHEASPENEKILLQLSEAYYGYAYAFIEDENPLRAGRLYDKAYRYAAQVLHQNEGMKRAADASLEKYRQALTRLDQSDVAALFFAATARMAWVGVNIDDPEVFVEMPKIKAMAKRIVELDESFYYGGAHALLGAFYAARSPVAGGKPEKAKTHFNRAFEISENRFLPYQLLYAEFYAYQIQDRGLYVKTLKKVRKAGDDILPERAFINAVAREKAEGMLGRAEDLF